jgi:hypothetical protein
MEDIIIGIALSDIVSKLEDAVDFDIDAENDALLDNTQQNTENIPVVPPANISASNPVYIQESSFPISTCYTPVSVSVCGLEIRYCKEDRVYWWLEPDPCGNSSDCPQNGCVLGENRWEYNQVVGSWFNTKVGHNKWKWCNNRRRKDRGGIYDKPDEARGNEAVVICPNDGSVPVYNDEPCNPTKGGCPGATARWVDGERKCIDLWWWPYSACYEWQSGDNGKHGPCQGPYNNTRRGPISGYFSCNSTLYYHAGYCDCDGDKNYSQECDTQWMICDAAGFPSVSYEGQSNGETFTCTVYQHEEQGMKIAGGGTTKLTEGTSVTLHKKSTGPANYTGLPDSITITIQGGIGNSQCDIIGNTPTSTDKWGGCFSVGAPYQCITSVPDELRCYDGDRYYTIEGGGSQNFSCKVECDKNTPPTATASIYIIKPTESRPTEPNMFLTLQEAKDQLANLNPNDPYYIRVDSISAHYTPPCEYSCTDKKGNREIKSMRVGNKARRSEGSLSLQNACVKCGCLSHNDCDGCSVCVEGNCVSYPDFTSGLGHPCMDEQQLARGVATKECCAGTDFSGNKVISCADLKNCEFCNDGLFGQFVDKNYIPELDQGCCPSPPNSTNQGTVYDTQCSKCYQYQVVDRCEPPEVCLFDDPSFSIITIDGVNYTKENKSCQIPPCPLCQRPHASYDTTGLCVHYEETEEGRECKQCEVVTEIDFISGEPHEVEKISSTLEGVEVCCQTGETTFEPAELCCSNSNGYNHTGDRDEGCCGDTTYRLAIDCCVNGAVVEWASNGCFDCKGKPVCPPGTTCCERLAYEDGRVIQVGCANPNNCEECGGAFEGPIVVPTYDTSDPCLECNNGSVDTITSDDPNDPCYSAAAPQSIFYQP